MKTVLATLLAAITLAWGWDFFYINPASSASLPWLIRQQALLLSGLWSIGLMSLVMLLATRPAWMERPLGGMDRVYRLHKWAGILAIVFAAAHWLLDMSSDLLKALIGKAGRPPKGDLTAFAHAMRDISKDMGEWAIYALLIMLAITLWKRFPYRIWRYVHRAMPFLYLALVFHTAVMAPNQYWSEPLGLLMLALMATGVLASIQVFLGHIGRNRRFNATIAIIAHHGTGVTEITCQLEQKWPGHKPGQFAFVTFDRTEGAHPFTISSAQRPGRSVVFQIKALGDYTDKLAHRLTIGQTATIEGPYGHFDVNRRNKRARQIWVAAGIGVTPFLSWLASLQQSDSGGNTPTADLHYFVRDARTDPFVEKLRELCAPLPGITLNIHSTGEGKPANAGSILAHYMPEHRHEIWYCGPTGLADTLKRYIKKGGWRRVKFHQEAFEMR